MAKQYNIAVVGVTGAVGQAMLEILAERDFPIATFYPVASERSAGEVLTFRDKSYEILNLAEFDFSPVDIALFSPGASVSAEYAPIAANADCVVIDNTSQFRYDDDIPLVVPEVNPDAIGSYTKKNIIANPNCSTIQMLVALKPIYDAVGISRINVATYQAVSGAGKAAISELIEQTGELLNGRSSEPKALPRKIAFNVIPHIDVFQDNGYSKEEMKMVWETQKIFADSDILVNPSCVRVPVVYGHSEAVHIETKQKITADAAKQLLKKAPGVTVVDNLSKQHYPTALDHGSGSDDVYVGRIREDISHPMGLNMWVVADNVRKGAALNAVQIAEQLITYV